MSISVVEIVQGYTKTRTAYGINGTRRFVSAASLPNYTPMDLPNIGDSWSTEYTLLVVVDISAEPIDNNPICGYFYTLSYASQTEQNGDDDRSYSLISLSFSSREYQWTQTGYVASCGDGGNNIFNGMHEKRKEDEALKDQKKWVWPDGETVLDATIMKKELMIQMQYSKAIYGQDDYNQFELASFSAVEKVNSGSFFGAPTGLALYKGFSSSVSSNWSGVRKFNVTMNFIISAKDGKWEADNGHNKVFRPSIGDWDEPVLDTKGMYEKTSFNSLLQLKNPPQIFPPLPEKL